MYKIIIISLIAVITPLELTIQNFQLLFAHNNAVPPILNNTTQSPFTKFFSESKDYQHCIENTNSCHPTVNVVYESPNTVVLKSHLINPLLNAVNKVKESDYNIDAVTYIPTNNRTNPDNPITLLVVMSPNTLPIPHSK